MVKDDEKWDGKLNHLSVFVLSSACKKPFMCLDTILERQQSFLFQIFLFCLLNQ